MMTIDQRNGALLVVAADSTLLTVGDKQEERFHPNSFVVLKYKPR